MIYADMSGSLIGCNELLLKFLGVETLESIPRVDEWFTPQGIEISFLLSQPGDYRGKISAEGIEYDVTVKSEAVILDNYPIIGVVFRDTSIIERARAAERYFENFKKKFLTNISHEFRTPMKFA